MKRLIESMFESGPDDELLVADPYSGGTIKTPSITDPGKNNDEGLSKVVSDIKNEGDIVKVDINKPDETGSGLKDEELADVEEVVAVLIELNPELEGEIDDMGEEEKKAWYERIAESKRVENAKDRYNKYKDMNIGNPILVTTGGNYRVDPEVWPDVSSAIILVNKSVEDSVICGALEKGIGWLSKALRGVASGFKGVGVFDCVRKLIEVAKDPEAQKRLANNIAHMYAEQGDVEMVNKTLDKTGSRNLNSKETKLVNKMLSKYEPKYEKV